MARLEDTRRRSGLGVSRCRQAQGNFRALLGASLNPLGCRRRRVLPVARHQRHQSPFRSALINDDVLEEEGLAHLLVVRRHPHVALSSFANRSASYGSSSTLLDHRVDRPITQRRHSLFGVSRRPVAYSE